jgi:hypothetical protein
MKPTIYIALYCLIALSQACNTIERPDRIIETGEVTPLKNVLLLDFTDQLCINCPEASKTIDILLQDYGSALVAVSIHSSRTNLPLVTEEGKEYDNHFGINFTHPTAVIDGLDKYLVAQWDGQVRTRFNTPAPIRLELTPTYQPETHSIAIASRLTNTSANGPLKYLLWIVEDGIVDWQKTSAKDIDDYYVHNHVFRTAVNSTWGDDLAIGPQEEQHLNHTFALPHHHWDIDHLSIVGFIYDATTHEVHEVRQTHIDNSIK